jgi:FkbM family methyltransferase
LSKRLSRSLASLVDGLTCFAKPYRRRITRALVSEALVQNVEIDARGHRLRFQSGTARGLHDPLKFGEDEPETVDWLEDLEPGILWDIGANIGLYSLYAAALGHMVVAFEPSASSYAALSRNIEINDADDRISAYCIALSDATEGGYLWMKNSDAGHSMHTIAGAGGRKLRQAVPVFTGTDFNRLMGVPSPDYVKLDVDGIETSVLQGLFGLGSIRAILVEAEAEDEKAAVDAIMLANGFERSGRRLAPGARNLIYEKTETPPAYRTAANAAQG